MTDPARPETGAIVWTDLTVDDAERVRDFYARVVGWTVEPTSMGSYDDFTMVTSEGKAVAGVCHRRGPNAEIPPQWLVYLTVADLDASLAGCAELGGAVLVGPRDLGPHGRMAVVRDPAGAVCALLQPRAVE